MRTICIYQCVTVWNKRTFQTSATDQELIEAVKKDPSRLDDVYAIAHEVMCEQLEDTEEVEVTELHLNDCNPSSGDPDLTIEIE